jgi:hypothetical protein
VNSFYDSIFGVRRETLMINDVLMKVVSEEVAATSSAMSIINCKECGFDVIFVDIKDYADSVLIIVSGDALVGIDCI